MRELGHRKTAQVADHIEYMLVDGIDVKEVMLHLTDHAAKGGEIATEDAVLVHALQLAHDARWTAQYLHEERPMLGNAPELPDRSNRSRATAPATWGTVNAFQFMMLLQQDKRFQHRAWMAAKQRFIFGFEQLVAAAKALIIFCGECARAAEESVRRGSAARWC